MTDRTNSARIEMQSSTYIWTEVIDAFKLTKAVLLVAVAIGALRLLHRDVGQAVEGWIYALQLDPDNQHIQALLRKLWSVDDRTLKEISAGTFSYAGLFLIEGAGLLFRKRWAPYLTIVLTASFLPLEIYELAQKPTGLKVLALAVNAAILVYLFVHVRHERLSKKESQAHSFPE